MTEYLTRQQILDISCRGLIYQGRPSLNLFGSCKFLTPTGYRCALGMLIPRNEYDTWMDSGGAGMWYGFEPLNSRIRPEDQEFAQELQSAHDHVLDAENRRLLANTIQASLITKLTTMWRANWMFRMRELQGKYRDLNWEVLKTPWTELFVLPPGTPDIR